MENIALMKIAIYGGYKAGNYSGDLTGKWARVEFPVNVDAMLVADVDGDDRADVIAEALPDMYWLDEGESNAHVYWFEQPNNPKQPNWIRHFVTTQYTTNSLDVCDLDRDGAVDIIAGEHRGTKLLKIFKNVEGGKA